MAISDLPALVTLVTLHHCRLTLLTWVEAGHKEDNWHFIIRIFHKINNIEQCLKLLSFH